MHGQRAAIPGALCFWASNARGIDPDPQPAPHVVGRQIVHEHPSQGLLVDPAIFKCFVDRRPLSFKPQRLRDFGQRFRLRFRHQRIHRIKQGIFGPQQAVVIEIVTKLVPCVKVHASSAPCFLCYRNSTRFGNLSQEGLPFLALR